MTGIKQIPYYPSDTQVASPLRKTAAVARIVEQKPARRNPHFQTIHYGAAARTAEGTLKTYGPECRVNRYCNTTVGQLVDLYA